MAVTRWGTNAPSTPPMLRDVSQPPPEMAPETRGLSNEIGTTLTMPATAKAFPTLDAVKAWYAQRVAMRQAVVDELQAVTARKAELEALLAEIDALGPQ